MSIIIDFGDYGVRDLADVPPELGPALAAVITEILSWDGATRTRIAALADAELDRREGDDGGSETPSERLEAALGEDGSDINIWSCQDGSADEPVNAGPWLETLGDIPGVPDVTEVAAAVLARDFALITAEDFTALTAWWTAAGLPLPDPRAHSHAAGDAAEVTHTAERLRECQYSIPGWPLAAVV